MAHPCGRRDGRSADGCGGLSAPHPVKRVRAARPHGLAFARDITTTTDELWAAVETFDAEAAEIALARLFWDVPLSGAVAGVVLPFLREVGDRWEAGTLSVAHEHFVSDMLRRKLSALSSVPPQQVLEDASAPSPVVLLACPPGERHDLVLLCVALMLRERGVRARFLGADTPIPAVAHAPPARPTPTRSCWPRPGPRRSPRTPRRCSGSPQDHALYVAGRGADAQTVAEIGATALPDDPVRAVVFLVGALNELSGSW